MKSTETALSHQANTRMEGVGDRDKPRPDKYLQAPLRERPEHAY